MDVLTEGKAPTSKDGRGNLIIVDHCKLDQFCDRVVVRVG